MAPEKLNLAAVNAKITAPENIKDLSRVPYAYDWLSDTPARYLRSSPPALQGYCEPSPSHGSDCEGTGNDQPAAAFVRENINGFDIFPAVAGLPWPTGFHKARQSRHWRVGLQISSNLLELFAKDASMSRAVKPNGKSLAKIAAHEMLLPEEDRFTKFATYLFPEADEERTRLLAATIVFIVIFDDSWEMHSEDKLGLVRDDFIKRLESGGDEEESNKTPLQSLIDYVVDGLKHHDNVAGNAGKEVLDHLVAFCRHVPPQTEFTSLADYLAYRNIDAGVPYILACVKFSLESDIWIENPKMATILRLVSDHVSLVNDLASFDKELRAYEEGKVCYMINAVDVVKKLFGVPTWQSAKAITYAMQLEVEAQMDEELTRLKGSRSLNAREEQFVEASLTMTAGNLFYSVVTSRYGGEAARISA